MTSVPVLFCGRTSIVTLPLALQANCVISLSNPSFLSKAFSELPWTESTPLKWLFP